MKSKNKREYTDCSDCKHRHREYCTLFDDLIEYKDLCWMWTER